MGSTSIEWTDATWGPVVGCTKTSPGCAHCYAETMARRLRAMGRPEYQQAHDGDGWRLVASADDWVDIISKSAYTDTDETYYSDAGYVAHTAISALTDPIEALAAVCRWAGGLHA